MSINKNSTDRPWQAKSESLSDAEFEAFEQWVSSQPTLFDAHLALGISEPTLTAVRLKKGRGAPATIAKIRSVAIPNHSTDRVEGVQNIEKGIVPRHATLLHDITPSMLAEILRVVFEGGKQSGITEEQNRAEKPISTTEAG